MTERTTRPTDALRAVRVHRMLRTLQGELRGMPHVKRLCAAAMLDGLAREPMNSRKVEILDSIFGVGVHDAGGGEQLSVQRAPVVRMDAYRAAQRKKPAVDAGVAQAERVESPAAPAPTDAHAGMEPRHA